MASVARLGCRGTRPAPGRRRVTRPLVGRVRFDDPGQRVGGPRPSADAAAARCTFSACGAPRPVPEAARSAWVFRPRALRFVEAPWRGLRPVDSASRRCASWVIHRVRARHGGLARAFARPGTEGNGTEIKV